MNPENLPTGNERIGHSEQTQRPDGVSSLARADHAAMEWLVKNGISPVEREAWCVALGPFNLPVERLVEIGGCLKRYGIRPEDFQGLCGDYSTVLVRKFPGFPEDQQALEFLAGDLQAVKNHMKAHFENDDSPAEGSSLEEADDLRAALEPRLPEGVNVTFEQIGHEGAHGLIVIIPDDVPLSAEDMRRLIDDLIATHHLNSSIPIDVRKTTFD